MKINANIGDAMPKQLKKTIDGQVFINKGDNEVFVRLCTEIVFKNSNLVFDYSPKKLGPVHGEFFLPMFLRFNVESNTPKRIKIRYCVKEYSTTGKKKVSCPQHCLGNVCPVQGFDVECPKEPCVITANR